MTSSPTPAQRVALEAIRDGKVERYFPLRLGYRRTAAPSWVAKGHRSLGIRQDVLNRCQEAGWVNVAGDRARMIRPVLLTEAGVEALLTCPS